MSGKGTNKKTTLYVGGLEENVNEAILHSAFIPFGDIKDVNIPMDNTTGKHRGFGFVEYENAEVGSCCPLSQFTKLLYEENKLHSCARIQGLLGSQSMSKLPHACRTLQMR